MELWVWASGDLFRIPAQTLLAPCRLWSQHFTYLNLNCLICEMEVIIISTLQGLCQD